MSHHSLAAMMRELIAAPSISSSDPSLDVGNSRVSELIAGWCTDIGFSTSMHPVPGKKNHWNVIATAGRGANGLIFAGHTDTVPYDSGQWSRSPFGLTEASGRLYGLGTSDMKSFFALLMIAVGRFDLKKLKAPLTIIATADEETGMLGARCLPDLTALGAQVVIGEPTSGRPIRMHKGNTAQRVRLIGRSGHSSDPSNGNSALEGMHEVLTGLLALRTDLQQKYQDPGFSVPTPTINFGCIHGGDNANRICGSCEIAYDFRILPEMNALEILDQIRSRIELVANNRKLRAEFETILEIVPPLLTASDAPIVLLSERITSLEAGSVPFTTEAPFYRQQGLDALVLGPGDIACAHQPDEYIAIEKLDPTIDVMAKLIHEFCYSNRLAASA